MGGVSIPETENRSAVGQTHTHLLMQNILGFFCQNVPLPGNALHFASGDNVLLEQPFSRVTGFPSPTQGSRAHHAQFQTSPSPGPPPPPGAREAGSSSDGLGLAFFWEAAREAANPLDLGHKSVIC